MHTPSAHGTGTGTVLSSVWTEVLYPLDVVELSLIRIT